MTNVKTLSKVIAIALLAAGSTQAVAQETASTKATVTVQNAFTLESTADLNFGTIRVTADLETTGGTGEQATVVVKADGTDTTATNSAGKKATAQVITDGTPATYAISKVAPFSKMVITFPDDDKTILTASSAPSESAHFTLSAFKAYVTSGTNSGNIYDEAAGGAGVSNLAADVDGNVTFAVGATLSTDKRGKDGAITQYIDGEYSAQYDMIVAY